MTSRTTSTAPVRTALITTNPHVHGGVSTHTATVFQMLQGWGAHPELIYAVSRAAVSDGAARSIAQAELVAQYAGAVRQLPSVRVPFGWSIAPALFARTELRHADMRVCVCGSPHIAFSMALLGMPYVLWMGTLWHDELVAQAENGDADALRLLKHPVFPVLAWQERMTLQRAKVVMTNSQHTTERVVAMMPGLASKVETAVIPVDTEYFTPGSAAHASQLQHPYVLLTARINDPRKNVPLLLQAFALIRSRFPEFRLVLAGESPNISLQQKVAELDLGNHVVFPGYVSRDELRRWYQGAHLYVLPSNQEGLGIVLLEAMSCGTPVISTRSGGPEHVITDPMLGRLVEVHQAERLAEEIADLLGQPERLAQMRTYCAAHVRQRYSYRALEQQVSSVLGRAFPEPMKRLGTFDLS